MVCYEVVVTWLTVCVIFIRSNAATTKLKEVEEMFTQFANRSYLILAIFCSLGIGVHIQSSDAQEENGGHVPATSHDQQLHFSHPLVGETPSPDTKIRLDYLFGNLEGGEQEQTLRVEGEFAFNRSFSIEFDVPYTFSDPTDEPNRNNLGNIELGFKVASFAFAEHGLLIGGGLEFIFPTGDDNKHIGTDHGLTIEPFISAGYKQKDVEIVGILAFGIPTNQPTAEKDEEDLELEFNLAFSYHINKKVTAIFEVDGEAIIAGRDNKSVVNLTPGLKFRPNGDPDLEIGVGLSFPISADQEFESQVIVSVFQHFH